MRRAALALALALAGAAQAGSLADAVCDHTASEASAAQADRLLQISAVLREQLTAQGAAVALVSRAGLQLQRFGVRYSHAALGWAAHPMGAWSVRQLYYHCGERRSRVFDQGLAGFLAGGQDLDQGFVAVLLLRGDEAEALAQAAAASEPALAQLHPRYSAIAFPWGEHYQNCNQWLAEWLAALWGGATDRAAAQTWLRAQGHAPEGADAGSSVWLWLARLFVPWAHFDDHPPRADTRVVTTLPADLERWLRLRLPQSERWELCHRATHWVMRREGAPLTEACEPQPGDLHGRF